MIRTISIGDSMLSLSSNRINCNVLSWIRLFHRVISMKKIVKLIMSILSMKHGRFRTKHSLFSSNLLFQNWFYHVFLVRTILIKFGKRFMSTSVFRRSLVRVNCELRCVQFHLKANQLMNICIRSKAKLMSSLVLECRFVMRNMLIRFLKDFHPIMHQWSQLSKARSVRHPLLRLELYSMVMKLVLSVTTKKLRGSVLHPWNILKAIWTPIRTYLVILVVLKVCMAAVVVIMVVSLTAVTVVVLPVTTAVAPTEITVMANWPIFNVKVALSMAILQMFVTLGLTWVFNLMNHSPSLIQQHFNLFPTTLVLSEPPILRLIPIPNLELLLQPQHNQVLCSPIPPHGNANSTWIPDSGASFHVTGEP